MKFLLFFTTSLLLPYLIQSWDDKQTTATSFIAHVNQNDINGFLKINTLNKTIEFKLRGCLNLNNNNHCRHNFTKIKIYSNPIPINGYWRDRGEKCDPTLLGSLTAIIFNSKNESIDFQKTLTYTDEISAVQDLRTIVISDENENPIFCSSLLIENGGENYVMRRHNANYYRRNGIKSYF